GSWRSQKIARAEPTRSGKATGPQKELGDEVLGRAIHDEMMGQDADGAVIAARAPLAQLRGEPSECRTGADKAAIALPGGYVEMHVEGGEAVRQRGLARRLLRQRGQAYFGQQRQKAVGNTVPWRHENRQGAPTEQRAQPLPPLVELVGDIDRVTLGRIFALLARSGAIGVTPA